MTTLNEVISLIDEMIKSVAYLINNALKQTTKIYDGIIVSNNNDGRWNVTYNGKTRPVTPYGSISPNIGKVVKIFVPQGNDALAFFM